MQATSMQTTTNRISRNAADGGLWGASATPVTVALALVCTAIPAIGWASGVGECKAAIANAKSPQRRNDATAFVIGDQRVVVANTEEGGLVCAFTVAGDKVSVSDVATGVDKVGHISAPRLIQVQGRTSGRSSRERANALRIARERGCGAPNAGRSELKRHDAGHVHAHHDEAHQPQRG